MEAEILLKVLLGILSLVYGGAAATNLSLSFAEDAEFDQHAIVYFSWTPSNESRELEGYRLIVEHIIESSPIRNICGNPQPTISLEISKNETGFKLRPSDYSLQYPLYTCNYRTRLVSLPDGDISNEITFEVSYDSIYQKQVADKQELLLKCNALYDPLLVMYNVTVTLDLSNQPPLALQALRQRTFSASAWKIELLHFGYIASSPPVFVPQEDLTDLLVLTLRPDSPNFVIIMVSLLETNRDPYYWRTPILPKEEVICETPKLLFHQPTLIDNDTIRFENVIKSNEIGFDLHWDTPTFINGDLFRYEVCVRFDEVELDGIEECPRSKPAPSNQASFSPMNIEGPQLLVQIRAVNTNPDNSAGDWSEGAVYITPLPPTTPTETTETTAPSRPSDWVFGVIGGVLFATLIVLVIIVVFIANRKYCFHWCSKEKEYYGLPIHTPPNSSLLTRPREMELDEWEIRRDDVDLFKNKSLGEGAFGAVYKGILQPKALDLLVQQKRVHMRDRDRRVSVNCVVAIKMLKTNTKEVSEKANFLKEIEMMKTVSGGNNELKKFVVNMLGCVTSQEPMLLILEFLSHGDLLSYLRSMRKRITEAYATEEENTTAAPYLEPTGVYSNLKTRDEEYEQLGLITQRNLVDFARQIAAGMEYLSSLGIVHRDLACRNVLVGEGKTLKVSDFGMSRLLPADEVYVPTSDGPLPLRWMAIEALVHRKFTSKTDVWSYGIVLWEISTMGGYPYPTISNRDLPEKIRSGHRMEKPDTCSTEVYEIMQECWEADATERPSFPELHHTFDKFLTQHTQDHYPYMELLYTAPHHPDTTDTTDARQHDMDHTPINLDIKITDTDTEKTTKGGLSVNQERRLGRSASHNQPRTSGGRNLRLPTSRSNLSLRNPSTPTLSLEETQREPVTQPRLYPVDQDQNQNEMEDLRYVVSPTSFTSSRNNSFRL